MPDDSASRLTLEVDRSADPILVRCRGRLVSGATDTLQAGVTPLIPGAKRIILDLTDLSQMDSFGLGTIVRLYVSAKSAGCELQLVNLGPKIAQLLRVTHLLSILTGIGKSGVPYI